MGNAHLENFKNERAVMDRLNDALIGGTALTLIMGGFGYLLKRIIWNSKVEVINARMQGRKFSSFGVMFAVLSGGHFIIKLGLLEGMVNVIVATITFGILSYAVGYLYWKLVKEKEYKFLLWIALIFATVLLIGNDDGMGGDEMYFSFKYAIMYAIVGLVANAYFIKEGEKAKIFVIASFALCVIYTASTYGVNYGILTAIEYSVGFALATIFMKKTG